MINIIVAMAKNRAIGKDNDLLLHLPEDLRYFKKKTDGHIVIMGSKTFKSLPNGALPNRDNIVITRSDFVCDDVKVAHSIDEAIELAKKISVVKFDKNIDETDLKKIFIIGGASIYEQCISLADRLYITYIFEEFNDADTYFPEIDSNWKIVNVEAERENIENKHPHVFVTYERV